MEVAPGTDAVTPRAAAPMVAVPLAGQALLARSPGFGGTMPGMTTKIALRGRNQEAYRRWIANRDDCITAHGLDGLMANAMMPTLDTVKERYPELSLAKQQETLSRALQQYQDENTALYFLVKESVIISGAYEALDREYITNKFVGQNGARNLRDGLGFLRWVDSFFDVTKDDAQINIKKDFTTKMKVSSGDASRDNMEKSWLDGLQVWKTINGNNEYDRVSLETYYTAIRDGLPDKPSERARRRRRDREFPASSGFGRGPLPRVGLTTNQLEDRRWPIRAFSLHFGDRVRGWLVS